MLRRVEGSRDEVGSGVAFVDVHEPEEQRHGHIDGSVRRPGAARVSADLTIPRHKAQLDPSRRIIVVCVRCTRVPGCPTLRAMSYQNVAILKEWTVVGLLTNEHEYVGSGNSGTPACRGCVICGGGVMIRAMAPAPVGCTRHRGHA